MGITGPWVLLAVIFSFALQVGVIYIPFMQTAFRTVALSWRDWGLIFAVAAPIFIISELFKWAGSKFSQP